MEIIKRFFTKKNVIIAAALAVAVAGVMFMTGGKNKPAGDNGIITNGVRTTILRPTTLSDTVTVTGTVESVQTINITSTTEGTTVKEILVQVGDKVAKDEIIMKLDTGTILERIEKEKEKLSESYNTAFKRREDAEEARNEAKDRVSAAESARDAAYTEMTSKKSAMDSAKSEFDVAVKGISPQQTAYDNAVAAEERERKSYSNKVESLKNQMISAETALKQAQTEEKTALENKNNARNALNSATDENRRDLQTKLTDAETAYTAAQGKTAAAQSDYDTAKNNYEDVKTNEGGKLETAQNNTADALSKLNEAKTLVSYTQLQSAYNSAKSAYDSAVTNYNSKVSAVETRQKSYEQKKETYEDYLEDLNDYTTSDTLEDLYEQYDDCIIKAPENGTITAINVEVGGNANGTLAVIQDTANLKISTSFAESDVQNITIGMRCTITSDANNNKITGYVSQISPTAGSSGSSMGMSSSSGDVSFPAEITIEGTTHGLLIGMNARADVILSRKDNVFTVPYDAVGTNENGEKVVYVQDTENKEVFTPVVVTTGMETDYYIEISSEKLSAGMVIRSSANESESGNEMFMPEGEDGEMPQMSGFGNMGGFGGGMPSGGGMPQGGSRPQGGGMPGGRG